MNHLYKNLLTLATAMFVLLAIFSLFGNTQQDANEIPYSKFMSQLRAGEVAKIVVKGEHIDGELNDKSSFTTNGPTNTERVQRLLQKHDVEQSFKPADETGLWQSLLYAWGPILLFTGLWFLLVPPAPVGRRQGDELRQVAREAAQREPAAHHVRRRRGHRGGEGRARGDRRLPARSRRSSRAWAAASRRACS